MFWMASLSRVGVGVIVRTYMALTHNKRAYLPSLYRRTFQTKPLTSFFIHDTSGTNYYLKPGNANRGIVCHFLTQDICQHDCDVLKLLPLQTLLGSIPIQWSHQEHHRPEEAHIHLLFICYIYYAIDQCVIYS